MGSNFLNGTPKAQEKEARIDKWDCIKLKIFCTTKETTTRMKRQPQNGRKFLLTIYLAED
jgi:hypothetical protein